MIDWYDETETISTEDGDLTFRTIAGIAQLSDGTRYVSTRGVPVDANESHLALVRAMVERDLRNRGAVLDSPPG